MAARVITEDKSGNKSSTDFYLGSQSHYALLHQQNALEKVDWSGTFPWIKSAMEVFPREGVLVYDDYAHHPTDEHSPGDCYQHAHSHPTDCYTAGLGYP